MHVAGIVVIVALHEVERLDQSRPVVSAVGFRGLAAGKPDGCIGIALSQCLTDPLEIACKGLIHERTVFCPGRVITPAFHLVRGHGCNVFPLLEFRSPRLVQRVKVLVSRLKPLAECCQTRFSEIIVERRDVMSGAHFIAEVVADGCKLPAEIGEFFEFLCRRSEVIGIVETDWPGEKLPFVRLLIFGTGFLERELSFGRTVSDVNGAVSDAHRHDLEARPHRIMVFSFVGPIGRGEHRCNAVLLEQSRTVGNQVLPLVSSRGPTPDCALPVTPFAVGKFLRQHDGIGFGNSQELVSIAESHARLQFRCDRTADWEFEGSHSFEGRFHRLNLSPQMTPQRVGEVCCEFEVFRVRARLDPHFQFRTFERPVNLPVKGEVQYPGASLDVNVSSTPDHGFPFGSHNDIDQIEPAGKRIRKAESE